MKVYVTMTDMATAQRALALTFGTRQYRGVWLEDFDEFNGQALWWIRCQWSYRNDLAPIECRPENSLEGVKRLIEHITM